MKETNIVDEVKKLLASSKGEILINRRYICYLQSSNLDGKAFSEFEKDNNCPTWFSSAAVSVNDLLMPDCVSGSELQGRLVVAKHEDLSTYFEYSCFICILDDKTEKIESISNVTSLNFI